MTPGIPDTHSRDESVIQWDRISRFDDAVARGLSGMKEMPKFRDENCDKPALRVTNRAQRDFLEGCK